ncbi:ankyrin repeat domain-containing protein SOWAHC-like isoform X2 [Protopterus annectens]|uniref:ankyrin repeat domain-containing protein SOWAHC-like isoform X2 n=1 Tax=Protopterus annectens TaxID=7888 RepID=UPI001CFAD540|nr:ankyrin repeat domain-containing protein SOWAHC-like isoform X2 [Protopterus annectens]
MDLNEDSILRYLITHGGTVANSDMMKEFHSFIQHSDTQRRAQYRQTFKEIIDKVALVKQEGGEKRIHLKKKYQYLLHLQETAMQEENKQCSRSPVSSRVAAPVLWEGTLPQTAHQDSSSSSTDFRPGMEDQEAEKSIQKYRRHQGAMTPEIRITEDDTGTNWNGKEQDSHWVGWSRSLEEPLQKDVPEDEEEHENRMTEGKSDEDHPSISGDEDVDDGFKGETESEVFEDGTGSEGSAAVVLDQAEKNWMLCAAKGQLASLRQLLQQDPALAHKKDFTSGFTALHWAAKHGMEELVVMLVNAGADVNSRSGGYTPLHIAALHNHRHIYDLLVTNYGAKEKVRDYSGRLPSQYLKGEHSLDDSTGATQFQQSRSERRNRKLAGLFHHSKSAGSRKKWGSMEDLLEEDEDKTGVHYLALPASYKPVRKFSR